MKSPSLTTALIFSLLVLFGCKKESLVASFTIDKSIAEVGEIVSFSNLAENSTEYIWDFGDGNASAEINPTHIYEAVGTYTVKLTAFGNGKRGVSTEIIEVVPATFNIEPGVRVGNFYLTDDLGTHFAKLDENRMSYSSFLPSSGGHGHIFTFGYAGLSFYLFTPTEDYTLDDVPSQIHAYFPFEGSAMGRISFGSSFDDVVKSCGFPLDVFSTADHFYDGIIFYADNSKLFVNRMAVL